ncbi:PAS domain S-box protein [Leptospira sp. GIMC2001]|uniref:PAS domain S-box protein n=1 Tax=Leptospira sp. GIMC2001 TaxID=1513297 RepID=UPI00234A08D5|nr:PAS domain S-box protein [Leptospira sp. GIMC2001]WCL50195.1 PAS domain S-box protein [Leptospira sp. GIMC2001]
MISENFSADWELQLLLENTQESFLIIDRNLAVISFNRQFEFLYSKYFGIQVRKGVSILEYAQPERREIVAEIYRKVFAGEEIISEIVVPTKEGNTRYFELKYKPAFDTDRNTVGAFISCIDITDRKNYEATIIGRENRFRSLVENSRDSVAIISADGQPTYVTPSIEKVLGYTEEESSKLDLFSLIHDDDKEGVQNALSQAIQNPGISIPGHTSRMLHKNGSWRWIESTIKNLLDDPNIQGIVDNFRDVTDSHNYRLEQNLISQILRTFHTKEDLEESIVDVLKLIGLYFGFDLGEAWLVSRTGNQIHLRGKWCRSHELEIESINSFSKFKRGEGLPGSTWEEKEIIFWENLSENPKFVQRDYLSKLNLTAGLGLPISIDNQVIAVFVFFSNKNNHIAFNQHELLEKISLHIGIDIARKISEDGLKNILRNSPDLLGIMNFQGQLLETNPAFLNSLEYSESELLSRIFTYYIHSEDKELMEKWIDSISNDRNPDPVIIRCQTKLNQIKWISWSFSRVTQDSDVFFIYGKDITERKQNEIKLLELNTILGKRAIELISTNRELEQFAFIASHDLQEPLRMVTSFLSRLETRYKDVLDDVAKQYIDFAVDGATRMRRIILDLLEYSRLGKKDLPIETIELGNLLKVVLNFNKTMIDETNAIIEIKMPMPTIQGAKTLIQQVFHNIIVNAIKYRNPDCRPEIEISHSENPTHWIFSIKDNGIGIDKLFFDKIFVIFQRLHSREEYSGTGIGLAITKKIVENHNGTVWVESELGKGSVFHFSIGKNQ